MKILAIVAIALAANFAVGATSVTVYGYGSDRETAKQDAFKTAIENVCGVAVLSDREHFNGNTTHNKVLSYSSCRVKKYHIIEFVDNRIKVEVTLTNSNVSSRLHSESNERLTFDNNNVREQLNSLRNQQQNGDRLIDEVFRDYPYRAYNLNNVKSPYFFSDERRNVYLMVPYDISWNYNFIVAMNETFSMFKSRKGHAAITVTAKNPKNFILGRKDYYLIEDLETLDHIKSKFGSDNEMRLKINARDTSGKSVVNVCYNPEYRTGGIFFSTGIHDELSIFGNDRNAGLIKINLTIPAEVIYDITLDIVAQRDCKLYAPPL